MATDKKISYAIQGGGPNYLGKQKMVTAPKKWKSSPKHPTAHLAYITKKEQDLLIKKNIYGSLKNGKPNRGPSGIMSLQGDLGGYDASPGGPDAGGAVGSRVGDLNKNKQRAKDIMTGKVNVGQTVGYSGRAPTGRNQYGDFVGPGQSRFGALGNIGRGIMSMFGGIPGKIGSLISTGWGKFKGKDLANATTTAIENDPDYLSDMDTGYARTHLSSLANKMSPIEAITPVSKPTMEAVPNEAKTNFNQFTGEWMADGGRIGYRGGLGVDPVLDVQEDENTLEFMNDQGIPHGDMAGTSPFEMRINELMDEGMSWQEAYQIASEEFGQVVEGESDQGIASII